MISNVVRLFIKDWGDYTFLKKYQTFLAILFVLVILYGSILAVAGTKPTTIIVSINIPIVILLLIAYATTVYYFGAASADKKNKMPLVSTIAGWLLILFSWIIIGIILYYAGTGASNKKNPENDIWAPEETKK